MSSKFIVIRHAKQTTLFFNSGHVLRTDLLPWFRTPIVLRDFTSSKLLTPSFKKVYFYIVVNSRVKYLYHSEGETVFLKCKSIVNSTGWVGPAQQNKSDLYWVMETDIFGRFRKWNTSLFTSGEQINPSLPHKNKLKLIYNKETGNTILRIRNFSKSDEGLYICYSSPPNGSVSSVRFILQKKSKYHFKINW